MPPKHGDQSEIHKVMPVKIFCAKHDLLMELIAFQVHSDSFQQSDLNVCLKFSLRILPSGKFHLLTIGQPADIKPIIL